MLPPVWKYVPVKVKAPLLVMFDWDWRNVPVKDTLPLLVKLLPERMLIEPKELVSVPLLTTVPSRSRVDPFTSMTPSLITPSRTAALAPNGLMKKTTFREPVPLLVIVPCEMKPLAKFTAPVADVKARTPPVPGLSAGLLSSQPSRRTKSWDNETVTPGKLGNAVN